MKKVLILALLMISVTTFGQLTLINVGTAPGSGNGDPLRTAFQKTNLAITQVNTNTASILLKANLAAPSFTGLTTIYSFKTGRVKTGTDIVQIDSITSVGGNIRFYNGATILTAVPATGSAAWGTLTGSITNQVDLTNALNLKANLISPTFTGTPVVPGYVATSVTVNGHALSSNVTVSASDVSLGNVTNESKATMFTSPTITGTPTIAGYVPTSVTINGHALTGNVSVTTTDLSLQNVTNESKATMFTSPTFTSTVTIPTPFTIGIVSVTANGTELNVLDNIPGTLTSTELGYSDGVTSAIQTQFTGKVGTADTATMLTKYVRKVSPNTSVALGTGSITMTGSLGATGARLTKGWFADIEITNAVDASTIYNKLLPDSVQKTGNFTLALTDANKDIYCVTDAINVITIPANATVVIPIGTTINFYGEAGILVFKAAANVHLHSDLDSIATSRQHQVAGLKKRGLNYWILYGHLTD